MCLKKPPMLSLIETHQKDVKDLMDHFASLSLKSIRGDDFVFVPGDARMPLLVAHADTVHEIPKQILYDRHRNILRSPTGLGADDRAGVYALLVLRENLSPKPSLLLTDKEETGGAGAYSASYDVYDQLREFPFFLEIDRRGYGEAVFYNYEGSDFKDYVCSFGFEENAGIFSDISILGDECKKCSVNLSSGYYLNHTANEFLVIHHLEDTIRKARRLILNTFHAPDRKFKLPKPPQRCHYEYEPILYRSWNWPSVDEYMRDTRSLSKESGVCDSCGRIEELLYSNPTFGWLCYDCTEEFETMDLEY